MRHSGKVSGSTATKYMYRCYWYWQVFFCCCRPPGQKALVHSKDWESHGWQLGEFLTKYGNFPNHFGDFFPSQQRVITNLTTFMECWDADVKTYIVDLSMRSSCFVRPSPTPRHPQLLRLPVASCSFL